MPRATALKVGILIIGSLIWDDKKERPKWRNSRLRVEQKIAVNAPIRYGRKAISRDNTYTMVLSRNAPLGSALIVPCRRHINGVEFIEEAVWLWQAEAGDPDTQKISAHWGCVAMLARDEGGATRELIESWAQRVARESYYGNIGHAHNEQQLVSKKGLLQIDWPTHLDSGQPADFDILLATTNQPTLIGPRLDYAPASKIAEEWVRSPHNNNYFFKNRENGIKTFEDDEIMRLLQQHM